MITQIFNVNCVFQEISLDHDILAECERGVFPDNNHLLSDMMLMTDLWT